MLWFSKEENLRPIDEVNIFLVDHLIFQKKNLMCEDMS